MLFNSDLYKCENSRMDKEDGYVLVTVIFMIAILTISAAAIATMSQTESNIVRNERLYFDEFYNADSGISLASEIYPDWHTPLDVQRSRNGFRYSKTITGEAGNEVLIEAVRVDESYNDFLGELSGFAKDVPRQKHIDDPIIGSGTGVTGQIMIRRFAITATPSGSTNQIQCGVYKYIPSGS
ncbi:pilus assembly PilX N-terminal domain-containing protein [Desulforegula conservatrix]|uniref:pilus assembly PilX N-terminal domain-containing protein n=1 Tax=Desulforegula conservatrix TaxID=153026 RepID=UPI000488AD7B|nr:pilus assembly PilX N-terminal domain-containing protein [Desulforegula conservatrix]